MMDQVNEFLTRRFPYLISICAVLAFLFPEWFTWFKGSWITYGLAVIMLGMGVTLKPDDFKGILKSPKWVITGLLLQFTVMPLLGWGLGSLFGLPAYISAGLILVACCPGGTASNLIAFLARANVALSVTMTAFSTMLAIVMTPLMTDMLVGSKVEVDAFKLFIGTVQVVLLPIILGVSLNRFVPKAATKIARISPGVAVVAIVLIVASIIGARKNDLVEFGLIVVTAVLILHSMGFALGYIFSFLLTRRTDVARTVSIEVGMQNSGLGASLARDNFPGTNASLPCAISALTHCLLGSLVAFLWSRGPEVKQQKKRI